MNVTMMSGTTRAKAPPPMRSEFSSIAASAAGAASAARVRAPCTICARDGIAIVSICGREDPRVKIKGPEKSSGAVIGHGKGN